jgi:hypothetical protein
MAQRRKRAKARKRRKAKPVARPVIRARNEIVQRIIDRGWAPLIVAQCKKDAQPLKLQAINDWKKLRDGVPHKRVWSVSRATGLPPHEIRPDLFPRPTSQAAE